MPRVMVWMAVGASGGSRDEPGVVLATAAPWIRDIGILWTVPDLGGGPGGGFVVLTDLGRSFGTGWGGGCGDRSKRGLGCWAFFFGACTGTGDNGLSGTFGSGFGFSGGIGAAIAASGIGVSVRFIVWGPASNRMRISATGLTCGGRTKRCAGSRKSAPCNARDAAHAHGPDPGFSISRRKPGIHPRGWAASQVW